jgi:hypothetical protein
MRAVNLSPEVPQGWDMELHASFNESFVTDHPFTVSLYSTGDVKLTRDEVQQTATNAAMITGGTHEVLPFIALGASIHMVRGGSTQITLIFPRLIINFDGYKHLLLA